MISVFPDSCILEFQNFWKSGNARNTEIQKSEIIYVCRQTCMFVCMHVNMYAWRWK